MSDITDFALRHAMGERAWRADLVLELIDPVSGLLVRDGVVVTLRYTAFDLAAPRPGLTASGRFAFRGLMPDTPIRVTVVPRGAPFFPAQHDLVAVPREGLVRIVLVPRRDYPFDAQARVIHHRLVDHGVPVADADVAVFEANGLRAAPARTDIDGEFVLFLRSNGVRRPASEASATGPMPPGLETAPARSATPEQRVSLVFARGGERRRLPSQSALVVPLRGWLRPSALDDVIQWEDLLPDSAPAEETTATSLPSQPQVPGVPVVDTPAEPQAVRTPESDAPAAAAVRPRRGRGGPESGRSGGGGGGSPPGSRS
jgi:hypothetical protein